MQSHRAPHGPHGVQRAVRAGRRVGAVPAGRGAGVVSDSALVFLFLLLATVTLVLMVAT